MLIDLNNLSLDILNKIPVLLEREQHSVYSPKLQMITKCLGLFRVNYPSTSVSVEHISFAFSLFLFPWCLIINLYNRKELFFLILQNTLMYNSICKQVKYPAWGSM